jgi:hypothetical protein
MDGSIFSIQQIDKQAIWHSCHFGYTLLAYHNADIPVVYSTPDLCYCWSFPLTGVMHGLEAQKFERTQAGNLESADRKYDCSSYNTATNWWNDYSLLAIGVAASN